MKFIITSLFILLPIFGHTQGDLSPLGGAIPFINRAEDGNVVGSPYLYGYWFPAEIYTYNDTLRKNFVKYNLLGDYLVILANNQKDSVVLTKNMVQGFTFFQPKHQSFERQRLPAYTFVEKIYAGKHQVFVKYDKKKMEISETAGLSDVVVQRNYKIKSSKIYFLHMPDGKVHTLKSNKNALLKVLTENQKQLKIYLKKMKPDLDENADWIKLMQFYESQL